MALSPRRAAALALAAALPLAAHQSRFASATVRIEKSRFTIEAQADLDARLLAPAPATPEAREAWLESTAPAARETRLDALVRDWKTELAVVCGGVAAPAELSLPDRIKTGAIGDDPLSWPGRTLRLRGEIPAGARGCEVRFAPALGPLALRRLSGRDSGEPELLAAGGAAPLLRPAPPGFTGCVALGFRHILPRGLDHILFVAGLFLLSVRLKPLLWQVSAFTLAHTLTLGLAMAGLVSLPSRIVEPLIALSIVAVALENLLTDRLHAWRPALVFLFGLLHGLGFAGGLREAGLPREKLLGGLLGFNAGVELGQLAVLLAAFAAVGLFRSRAWYRARVVLPASGLIALTAAFWTVQRIVAPA